MDAKNGQTDPRALFPLSHRESPFLDLCKTAFDSLAELMPEGDFPRVPATGARYRKYDELVSFYGDLPDDPGTRPGDLIGAMTRDFLAGAVNWRSPELQYNLGAAVNVAASAMYAVALDTNVYLINDGLAGNVVAAEGAVSHVLAQLTGVPAGQAFGLFTFGGTGTMAYGIKAGIRKCAPESVRAGTPSDVRVVITEDAHFSHAAAADWLGIGTDQLVVIPADRQRRSDLAAAEELIRSELEAGHRVATVIINGGTTYDHAVDDIAAFAELRDRLTADYDLPYRPHLHVDSVVGWAWLMLSDSALSALEPGSPAADALREQHRRVQALRSADSWGVDFHKGVGVCPIDCSFIQFNDKSDCVRLRKGCGSPAELHQLAQDFSAVSPVDYTLETSRAGGKALAAVASLHSLGRNGYAAILTRLVDAAIYFRESLGARSGMDVLNPHALGYQTMVRLYPPHRTPDARRELHDPAASTAQMVREGNAYLKAFFAWDNETRMDVNGGGVVYSFSSKYLTTASGEPISGLKFYPTTPLIGREHMKESVDLLAERKAVFDEIWRAGAA
ncbi:pyridoxal phosphate-dependent decarboxylase family protein [Streptomyces sp. NPDC014872]|uniref:pyridoxal phosphate-dependent decarboxylase family protein n=1 Tax=Streptomyces sp. NPDC014872 TaxID=3364926 RepID=UPI0036F88508